MLHDEHISYGRWIDNQRTEGAVTTLIAVVILRKMIGVHTIILISSFLL